MRLLTIALLLGTHFVLPMSLAARIWRADDAATWFAATYVACAFSVYIWLAGVWGWFGRIARAFAPGATLVAVVASLVHGFPSTPLRDGSAPLLDAAIGSAFVALAAGALRGRRLAEPAIEGTFPLRGGTFIIAHGGTTRIVNYHVAHRSQRHAIDVLKLNGAGVRARGLFPRRVDRYAIYGAEVVAPVDGLVVAAIDGFPDLSPPDRDAVNRGGNHLVIETNGATVYLAHLMRGSLQVAVGTRVRAGQALARAGNSGNTTEPHLHVHAERGHYRGHMSAAEGVPLRFGGRLLVRNDRVRA
jgi:Peptidase family M23